MIKVIILYGNIYLRKTVELLKRNNLEFKKLKITDGTFVIKYKNQKFIFVQIYGFSLTLDLLSIFYKYLGSKPVILIGT